MPQRTPPPGRETGASAGSILLDVFAEYILPTGAGAWQETLIRAIGAVGHSSAAVRQAISRAVRDGALVTTRHGNRAYVELRPEAEATLRKGTAHLAAMTERQEQPWDGEWDVFVVRLPGKDSTARYHLRTSLLLKGLGYLGNGVWVSPSTPMRDEIAQALEAEPEANVLVMRSRIDRPALLDVVRRAWDIDAAADNYNRVLALFSDREPSDPQSTFAAWTELVHAWRQCSQADPGLPAQALPPQWPRQAAAALVTARRQVWQSAAHRYFDKLTADLNPVTMR